MATEILKQLGFSDKEVKVYLAILQQGKVTPAAVAELAHLNRSTVYSIAKTLIKKGVISEDLGGKMRYLLARSPEDLALIIDKEAKRLEDKKKMVNNAIHELQAFTKGTQYSIPKIVFIPGDELENYLYKQSPVWNESILKKDKTATWWGFQDRYFVSHYEGWIDWYWETSAPKEISLKLLSNESAEEIKEKKFSQRKIKFFKGGGDFTGTVWINGDYVIMIVCAKRPHYLVEIHDELLAHNLREVFKGTWKTVE